MILGNVIFTILVFPSGNQPSLYLALKAIGFFPGLLEWECHLTLHDSLKHVINKVNYVKLADTFYSLR